MNKLVGILIMLILCSSCSSSSVHLYARHLSAEEIRQVSALIEKEGFQVVINDLHFPDGVNNSAIIYSPFFEDPEAIDNILALLESNGWRITSTNSLFAGNHWYRKNDVAILLIPQRLLTDGLFVLKNIADTYESKHCSTKAKLTLSKDNTYKFAIEDYADNEDYSAGKWKFTQYPYVELRSTNSHYYFYFKVEHSTISDNISTVETTELIPEDDYHFFPGCSFIRGVRA